MQTLSGNQRPDFLISLMNMSLVLHCPGTCIFADPLQMSHACHGFLTCYHSPHVLLSAHFLTRCTIPCACHAKRACGVFNILTWKRASRHNSVHFSDISTSESGPELVCFVHFDLEMRFALQRRALFGHLNFQKCFAPQRRALFQHLNFQK